MADQAKKIDNKTDEVKGKVEQSVGKATDDEDLQRKGQKDETKGNVKQAGQKLKDAFKS